MFRLPDAADFPLRQNRPQLKSSEIPQNTEPPTPHHLTMLKGKRLGKGAKTLSRAACQMSERKKHLLEPPWKAKQNIAQIRERRKILCHHKRDVWQLNKLLHQAHPGGGYRDEHHRIVFREPRREQMLVRKKEWRGRLHFVLCWCCVTSSSHPLQVHHIHHGGHCNWSQK